MCRRNAIQQKWLRKNMPDTLKLYTSPLCPYAQRVRMALAEKGLEAKEMPIDLRNKPADFLALSPTGTVPLLIHDGRRIWDSAVINEYLEEAFPERPLLPESPLQRALARIWVSFADRRLFEPTHHLLVSPDDQRPAQLAKEVRFLEAETLARHDGPYLLGEVFSLADIALFPWFEQVIVLQRFRDFRMPECKRVLDWSDRIRARASLASVIRAPEFYEQGYAPLAELQRQGRL